MLPPLDRGSVMITSIGHEVPFPELAHPRLVVIGYAGRDEVSVRRHIDELAVIGIAPPLRVPMVYELEPDLLTTSTPIPAPGPRTSGEVEPVLVRAGGGWFLAVGSDHTDRELEATSVRDSKAVCPKPVSRTAIRLEVDPVVGGLDAAWDAIDVTSAIDHVAYQHGSLAGLRLPSDLIAQATSENPSGDLVIFGGTVPLLEGEFRYGTRFSATMSLPGEWILRLEYELAGGEL
jgi:4-hydroxyphenylacetate 3-monooxygenase